VIKPKYWIFWLVLICLSAIFLCYGGISSLSSMSQ
jgi:hypothetical protein